MIEILQLFILGIGVGCFGALVGIGGGLIMVPLFVLAMMPPNGTTFSNVQQVIGTSLFGVLLNAVSGTYAYLKQGRVFFKAAIPFALATVPGAFIGGYISAYFSGPGFSITFGITLVALGLFMYFKSSSKRANAMADQFDASMLTQRQMVLGVSLSFLVGFISSILGIGGGVIHVPLMIFILGFPAHIAVATSTFVLMVSSSIGVVSHALLNHIVWTPALCIGLGAIVGAQIGAKISQKSRPKIIVTILAFTMVVLGIQLVVRGL